MLANVDFAKLNLMDALDLAILIEIEALERYQLFAKQLGAGDAGNVFSTMAESEAKHAKDLSERRESLFGNAPVNVSQSDIYDVEAPDVGSPRWNMSELNALNLALNSEEKAFTFYDQALPHVENGEVRQLFHDLRAEEVEHVELVKSIIAKLPPSAAWDLEDLDE
ncbi:MAG: ferritin family protein [Proteobacteria bacterium]|jgi:erythrin-vacuolar iron transport family protein|nr:ferritin family protein [Pseudomonadota bacterium]